MNGSAKKSGGFTWGNVYEIADDNDVVVSIIKTDESIGWINNKRIECF